MKIEAGTLIVQGTVVAQLTAPIVSMTGGCTKALRQNGAAYIPSAAVFTC